MTHKQKYKKYIALIFLVTFSILSFGCGEGENTDNKRSGVNQEEFSDIPDATNEIMDEDNTGHINGNGGKNEENVSSSSTVKGDMEVHYIDVGQGKATLLKGPSFTILFDAGRHDRNDVVPYLQKLDIKMIDLLVGTHPHADHIGQIDSVMDNFIVKEVWMSGDEHTSQTFERVLDSILASDADYHEPRAGETYTIGSAIIEVINPERLTGNFHEGSISVRIVYGNIAFLFTGDAEHQTERAMINRGHELKANIFHLGHHGSSTSNTKEFLDKVNPEITIYSAGENNSYGHPHVEVVTEITNRNVPIYGTDIHGTIIVKTDGKSYSVYTEKTGTVAVNDRQEDNNRGKNEADQPSSTNNCVDINSASKELLTTIIHIGDARAEELIKSRPFQSINGLTSINGIGSARLNDIKDQGLACLN
ncbi:MBL fold metallo-hydrolase [Evansella sp. AB-rgal1]|uniref:MBL fold metallo-hydrolase n=1 Tax=Evansella sp. AB-rgal1 TaxID=3242696 RepID=UPI00359EC324